MFSLHPLVQDCFSTILGSCLLITLNLFGAELFDNSGHSSGGRSFCKCPNSGWRNGSYEGEKVVKLMWKEELVLLIDYRLIMMVNMGRQVI